MRIESTDPRAIRAGQEFPRRLQEIHSGRIVLRDTAVYRSNGTHNKEHTVDVKCMVCGWEWKPTPSNLISNKTGCPECARLRDVARAGTRRVRPSSAAEKELAKRMRATGMSYQKIADVLGRSNAAIQVWLNPEYREKDLQRSAKKHARNKASGKSAELSRNYQQTPHGKQSSIKKNHKRRSLEYHCSGLELVDGRWQENDLWTYVKGDREAYKLMSFPGADDVVAELKKECDALQQKTGKKYHIDHIISLNRGGSHHPLNLQILTASLNSSKQDTIRPQDAELFCKRIFNIK